MRVAVLATAMCLSAVGLSVAQEASAAIRKHTEIPAEELGTALKALAKDRGFQVVFRSEVVGSARTHGARGDLTTPEALSQLLEGTNLVFSYLDEKTVTVMMREEVAPGAAIVGHEVVSQPPSADTGVTQGEGSKKSGDSLRVAQAAPGQTAGTSTIGQQDEQASKKKEKKSEEELEQIIVTGTHIRGSANETAPTQVITREDIERSGYTTTQELVASIPQNFSGGAAGATEDGIFGNGSLRYINVSNATGVNLRGLGESSTLILINGHRMAPSAQGLFVDVSAIPLTAIDRVEVLTDGASAIYGADAVAGVVNFILRSNYSGQETRSSYGAAAGNVRSQGLINQAVGRDWEGGNGVLSLQYQKLGALSSADRSFTASVPQPSDILPRSEMYSGLFNVRQQLSSKFDLASDGFFTYQDRSDVETGADQSQTINSPVTREGTANVTFGYEPSHRWRIETSGSFSQEYSDVRFLQNPQVLAQCGSTVICHERNNFQLWSVDAKADGTLIQLPGGAAKIAFGASYRRESLAIVNPPGQMNYAPFARHVTGAFAEADVPLVGAGNALPLVSDLTASLAVRRDDYSDFGATTNPRYGLSWKPVDRVHVRGAYSTSFRAPNAHEQTAHAVYGFDVFGYVLANPAGGTVPAFILSGANGNLQPEKARNISIGVDYEPPLFARNLKLSVDYYNVLYRDRIITPPFVGGVLLNPGVYGSLITYLPNDAAAQAYLNALETEGAKFTDFTGNGVTGVRYAYSTLEQNAARVRQDGLDVTVAYSLAIGQNQFKVNVNGAYIHEIETAYTSTSTATDIVNTYASPLRWRARSDLAWSRKRWQFDAAVNYAGAYTDTSIVPSVPVSSWTTLDTRVAFQPLLDANLSIALSALNVLNRDPPWITGLQKTSVHYDAANANPLGRLISLEARIAW
jgi:iron complex outermembrane recepter protein